MIFFIYKYIKILFKNFGKLIVEVVIVYKFNGCVLVILVFWIMIFLKIRYYLKMIMSN